MGRWGSLLVCVLMLAGCTRTIDDASPRMDRPVGPIGAGQVDDLVSPKGTKGDAGDSLYADVTPTKCAGVAQEVSAPFVFDAKPVAHSGGYWLDEESAPNADIIEIVGVYHSDFDPQAAITHAKRVIASCRNDAMRATASGGGGSDFRMLPQADSGSPQIVVWSLKDRDDWACDNAFVAAFNAAVELTACSDANGYDVLTLARDALARIDALADATK